LTGSLLLFPILISSALNAGPMTIDRILLFGNVRTKNQIISRELKSRPGTIFSETLLREDSAWLKRLDLFSNVELSAVPDSTRRRCSLLVLLKEQSPWMLDPLLVYDGLFGWTAGCAVIHDNILGRRQQLRIGFKIGGLRQVQASWADPWFGGSLRLFGEVRMNLTRFRYLYADFQPHFRMADDELGVSLGRSFNRCEQIGVRVTGERVRADDPSVTFSGNGRDDLVTLECFQRWDSRDRPDYPLRGWFCEAGRRWTGPVSGFRFARTFFDFRRYLAVHASSCLALQAQSQISDGTVPVYKRIHVGGSKTLRGYDTDAIAGESFWMTSAEFRFPWILENHVLGTDRAGYFGVLFMDAAGVWYSKDREKARPNFFCAGFGFHFLWDSVVLRSEIGFRNRGRWFVSSATGVKF
jgi:outer membrane protein insertion porin family